MTLRTNAARGDRLPLTHRQPRRKTQILALLLYLVALTIDAARKVIGLPGVSLVAIFLLVGLMHLSLIPRAKRLRRAPITLPFWMVLLSIWCVIEAIAPRVPASMGILGFVSYIFFIPLLYIGAELTATDRGAAGALRVVAITGGAVGLGAVAGAILGQSAPSLLQPIIPSVGIHSFNQENIYLAPSIFATAEEAAEYMLIALFAWIALAHLPPGRMARTSWTVTGLLIASGLIAAERRADIVVAVAGVIVLSLIRPARSRRTIGRPTSRTARTTRSRLWPALAIAATGVITLLSFLGASKLVPFLTSASSGQSALALLVSPAHPGALSGQGTGTSTQGVNLVGATTFSGMNSHGPFIGYVLGGRSFITAEGGLTKTWLELGIIGVILYGGIFLSALGPLVCSFRQLDGIGRALTVLTLALGVVFLKGHQSLDDPLVQPLFWLCAGGAWGRMQASKQPVHSNKEKKMALAASKLGSLPPSASSSSVG